MPTTSDALSDLRSLFVSEARGQLAVVERSLRLVERNPAGPHDVSEAGRAMHNLKGSASMLGIDAVASAAWACEDVLDAMEGEEEASTSEMVSELLGSTATIARMLDIVERGGMPRESESSEHRASASRRKSPGDEPTRSGSGPCGGHDSPCDTVPVDVAKLDRLIEAFSEVVHERAPLDELGEAVAALRFVPLGPTLRGFEGSVRELAAAAGKHALLATDGDDVEVDVAMARALVEPLARLVKAAVDHGVEYPRIRIGLGKSSHGTVTIRASRAGSSIIIDVHDDGSGSPDVPGVEQVRRDLEALRGTVRVRSQPGVGTTVSVRAPAGPTTEDLPTLLRETHRRSASAASGHGRSGPIGQAPRWSA